MGTINSLIIHQEFIYDRCTLSAETPTMSIILNIKTIALTIFFTSSSLATTIQPSNPKEKMDGENKSIALYGNSYTHYNNHLNTRLRDLARSLLPNNAQGYSYRGITISSAQLSWHEPNLKYQKTLQPWDVVVFQGNSMEPISTDIKVKSDFQTAAKRMANFAHANGSKVLYFMTWAQKDKPEQTAKLANAYYDIAKETGGFVAPVGLAFEQISKQYPELNLYHSDGKHPSLEGTYLAAAVFFSILYNQSPIGGALPIDSNMSPETAIKLQTVAWETVQNFQSE